MLTGLGHLGKVRFMFLSQSNLEYAASTAFLSDEGREASRCQIVAEYGAGLELIDPA